MHDTGMDMAGRAKRHYPAVWFDHGNMVLCGNNAAAGMHRIAPLHGPLGHADILPRPYRMLTRCPPLSDADTYYPALPCPPWPSCSLHDLLHYRVLASPLLLLLHLLLLLLLQRALLPHPSPA